MSAVRYLLATLRAEVEDALAERAEAIAERDRLAAEVETLRARLAAAEALAEKWDASGCDGGPAVPCRCLSCASSDLRAALAGESDA